MERSEVASGLSCWLPHALTFALASLVFQLAFLISPYWRLAPTTGSRLGLAALTTLVGVAWAYLATGSLEFRLPISDLVALLTVLGAMLVLNLLALMSVVPWRGDEDFHLPVVQNLILLIGRLGIRATLLLMVLLFYCFFAYRSARVTPTLVVATLGLAAGEVLAVRPIPWDLEELARYPYVLKWVSAAVALPFRPRFPGGSPLAEASLRLVPFLGAVGAVWCGVRQLEGPHAGVRLLHAVTLATIPIVFYYSSIYYLEIPIVFLMTAVSFAVPELLTLDAVVLRSHPAWYALILIGFLKETTLVFLLVFLLCRLGALYGGMLRTARLQLWGECRVAFSVLAPLLTYLLYRLAFAAESRTFRPALSHLIDGALLNTLGLALLKQLGVVGLVFVLGFVLIVAKGEFRMAAFLAAVIGGTLAWNLIDVREFVGYSRFNLFLVPPVIVGAHRIFETLLHRSIAVGAGLMILAAGLNLVISPVNMDGTKKPLWGDPGVDTSDHYYPYREAFRWLAEHRLRDKIIVAGLYYPYHMEFYAPWALKREVIICERGMPEHQVLEAALAKGNREGYPLVLYHVLGTAPPRASNMHGYVLDRVFSNSAHELALYAKAEGRP